MPGTPSAGRLLLVAGETAGPAAGEHEHQPQHHQRPDHQQDLVPAALVGDDERLQWIHAATLAPRQAPETPAELRDLAVMVDQPSGTSPSQTTCYRHSDRSAGVRCQRCDRYICPACMNTASVGFHCPECAKAGKQKVYTGAAMFHGRPIVSQVLMAVNVAVFVVSVAMGDGFLRGAIALDGLLIDGALFGPAVDQGGEWYRIITSGFLHYGAIHLAFNMYALWILGPTFERSLGSVRFALIYLASLLGGAFGALLVSPDALTAGASGAIFGLLGVAVISQRSLGISLWQTGLGYVLLLNLLITFGVSSISVGGHLGGLTVGLLAGWLVYEAPRRVKFPPWSIEAILVALSVICFVGALAAAGI